MEAAIRLFGAFSHQRAKGDARIRILTEPHRGLTASLNRGLALARGTWIARQDADDWSEPTRLERQVDYFREHPETIVLGTGAWTHQQDGRPLWPLRLPWQHADILRWLPRGNPFVHGSVMFPRAAAVSAGGYREEFRCSQDYDFLWRLAERGNAANLAEPLYHYRYTSGSVSAGRAEEQARAHRAIQLLAASRQRGEPEDIAARAGGGGRHPRESRTPETSRPSDAGRRLPAGVRGLFEAPGVPSAKSFGLGKARAAGSVLDLSAAAGGLLPMSGSAARVVCDSGRGRGPLDGVRPAASCRSGWSKVFESRCSICARAPRCGCCSRSFSASGA